MPILNIVKVFIEIFKFLFNIFNAFFVELSHNFCGICKKDGSSSLA